MKTHTPTLLLALALAAPVAGQTAPAPPATPPAQEKPAREEPAQQKPVPKTTTPATAPAAKREQPPPLGPVRPFEFPSYTTRTLSNGATVFVIEDKRQPLVSYTLMLPAGATRHDAKQAGLASLTAGLLRQGTETRTAQEIARTIDRVGGSLEATAGEDFAQVSATVMKPDADLAVELLADVVLRPTFAQEEIDRLRRQTLSGLQVRYADPEYIAPIVAERLVYGQHPYGLPVEGTPDTLPAITREQIVAFHKAYYQPQGALFAVAGDITADQAVAQLEKHFAGWKGESPATPLPEIPASTSRVVAIDKPDAVQTQIVLASTAIRRNDPDYLPLLVANQVFGGSFNSRLNLRLRAKEGLTYGARSSLAPELQAGVFQVSTFTRTEETGRTVSLIGELLREFRKSPATDAELQEARSYLVGSFALGTETADQVASRVLTAAAHKLPPDYWQRYRENVQAVTPEAMQAAVQKHIDADRMTTVLVGNVSGFKEQFKTEITVIPITALDVTAPNLKRADSEPSAATPEAKAKGESLVRAAVDAVGGADALAGVKDYEVTGTISISTPQGQLSGDAVSRVLYPDRARMTITLPMGELIQNYDGQTATMKMGPQTMDIPTLKGEMERSIALAGGIGLLRDAVEGTATVQALDPAEVAGKPHDVVLWTKGNHRVTVFLDPETHLIAKLAYRAETPQGLSNMEMLVSDYRPVGTIKVPWKSETLQNGQPLSQMTVSAAKVNSGLTPDLFEKPQPQQ